MAYPQIAIFHVAFMLYFSLGILVVYFIVMFTAWYGWIRLKTKIDNTAVRFPAISIVIAARNEDQSLPELLSDLAIQDFPSNLIEIIVVDDHSDNKISASLNTTNPYIPNLQIIELSKDKQGKKQALIEGASISRGELLIFTDADCRVSPQWVRCHANKFLSENSGLIIGLVSYPHKSGMFQLFSRFELISLIITGAGLANMGKPVMCNGANLSVRRDLFIKLSDQLNTELASGDDMFLLHAMKKNKNVRISVLSAHESVVIAQAPQNINEFINQRMRWTSKSKHYSDGDTLFLAWVVLISNIFVVFSFLGLLMNDKYIFVSLLFVIKLIADSMIIFAGLQFFGRIRNMLWLPLFEIIYPLYILFITTGSIFRNISWKGRKIH